MVFTCPLQGTTCQCSPILFETLAWHWPLCSWGLVPKMSRMGNLLHTPTLENTQGRWGGCWVKRQVVGTSFSEQSGRSRLAMSRDVFGCQMAIGVPLASSGSERPEMLSTIHGTTRTTKNYPIQNINSDKTETLWFRVMFWGMLLFFKHTISFPSFQIYVSSTMVG